MNAIPVLFAMRPAIGAILIVMAIGLVIGGVFRVILDAIAWYKDEVMDPYRDLRKEVREKRMANRARDDAGGASHGAQQDGTSDRL